MYSKNFVLLLAFWLEVTSLLVLSGASPSFKFIKASESHSGSSESHPPPSSGGSTNSSDHEIPNVERLCPLAFSDKDAASEKKMKHELSRMKAQRLASYARITVPVIFHVVAANSTVKGGHISHHNLVQQIQVLNRDFSRANVAFSLQKINRITNARWFRDVGYGNREAIEMRAATREGNQRTLNVWTTSFSKVDFTGGYAQYPWHYTRYPKEDGVTMRHDFFYGGSNWIFNDGRYLTHEVGHWVGLFHTFEQENCNSEGDYVADTPAQKSASSPGDTSCRPKDTCKNHPGNDPITNFMDYSHPKCQHQFTDGQIARMRAALSQFRGYPYTT